MAASINSNIQLYEITHTSPEYKTVGELLNSTYSPLTKFYKNKEEDFVAIKDENGVSNKDRIIATYTPYEKNKYADKAAKNLLLKIGTKLIVAADKIERNVLLTQGIEITSNSDVAFKAQALAEIESDPGYIQIAKPVNGDKTIGITKEIYPDMTVWIWCRGLTASQNLQQEKSDNYEMTGQIFDLTPFVSRVNTNMSKNGGTWNMVLPPLTCSLDEEGKWVIKKASLQFYSEEINKSLSGQGYVAESSLFDSDGKRNQFLFHNIIGSNDLIFIRYETLGMETKDRFADAKNLYVDKKNIPGKIYDMIGLTDVNGITFMPQANEVGISLSGRDLSKLFVEDGTYFYALEFSQRGNLTFSGGSTQKNSLVQRVFSDNMLLYYNLWYSNSIERAFQFIIQQLSTIKVVPDNLFQAYGNRRNTRFDEANFYKANELNDQKNIFESNARESIKVIRFKNDLTDESSQINEDTQVTNVFSGMLKFLRDIRTQKVRKITGNDTSGWKALKWIDPNGVPNNVEEDAIPSYFDGKLIKFSNYQDGIALSDFESMLNNIDSYVTLTDSQSKHEEKFERKLEKGIWQIIKLVIDKSVTERRIVDQSASSANGSLMNFFRKLCQEPFVEYYGDTYGDTYNMVVRKPPTDQVSLISLIEGKVISEDGRITTGTPAIIDINPEDVIQEDLYFDDKNVYSWYHLQPRYNSMGGDNFYSYTYLPALFFEEYADIWGSRPMDLTHNYMPFLPLDVSKDSGALDVSERQAIYDLKYMVESNQMNPFTRSGVIKVNGDRRLKIGNIIRYKPTGEIFMIDMVQQSFIIGEGTIDRTTTINVSRGMVEQLIYGISVIGENIDQEKDHISYFNIIDTEVNLKYKETIQQVTNSVKVGEREVFVEKLGNNFVSSEVTGKGNSGLSLLNKYNIEQKNKFVQLINSINSAGYTVIVTSTVRSFSEQVLLYNENHKNAVPGTSKHESGRAIDLNIRDAAGNAFMKSTSKAKWIATGIPALAKSMGFKWGGDSFGSYYDPVHFELVNNITEKRTEPVYNTETKNVKINTLDRSAIFSNFKVNRHVFNFFLRNEQFNKIWNNDNISRWIYKSDVRASLGEEVVIKAKKK